VKLTIKQVVSACTIGALIVCSGLIAIAQGQQPSPRQEKPLTPLKVVVTISRWNGTKQTSNLPFTMWVNSNDPNTTSLNVGQRVVYETTGKAGEVSYGSLNVGTTLSCNSTTQEDGRFRLILTVSDTSIAPGKEKDASGGPTTLSFTTTTALLLRDGQTAQFTTATDKISGEVTKVDVTVSVLK